ncbi:hypothetical protein BXZ70DRAFT_517995 [Cristinia sonorae]|uniref:Uncharacterized protein n=1 Tax=Cristinia sonorae TaxID=1940300 RepID=A0A8K0UWA1_9AGAR|nr:hypothetical protein BXZ70DRAFT_517995 [Cristinia sonorae]
MTRILSTGLVALLSAALLVSGAASSSPREVSTLEKRNDPDAAPVLIGCYPGGAQGCPCPKDKNGDSGVLINFFPGYQCAYPDGACSWDDQDGSLLNIQQTNCPSSAPCPSTGCQCIPDLNNNTGVLINYFTGYQCAYPNGACTWDSNGSLTNTRQGNCPATAVCDKIKNKPPPPKHHPPSPFPGFPFVPGFPGKPGLFGLPGFPGLFFWYPWW